MAWPATPVQTLSAVSVTSTATSGQSTSQATAAAFATHSAVFTVSAFNAGEVSPGSGPVLVLTIEGNLDGSTWVTLGEVSVEGNGTYLVVPTIAGQAARIPVANLRTSAYFKGFGSGSPTATVTAWLASEA